MDNQLATIHLHLHSNIMVDSNKVEEFNKNMEAAVAITAIITITVEETGEVLDTYVEIDSATCSN